MLGCAALLTWHRAADAVRQACTLVGNGKPGEGQPQHLLETAMLSSCTARLRCPAVLQACPASIHSSASLHPPTMPPPRSRMALMRCRVPGMPARLSE